MVTVLFATIIFVAPQPTCPENTTLHKNKTAGASESWCAKQDGTRQGPRWAWYKNGQLWFKGTYENNQQSGEWEFWHPSGAKMSKSTYKDGKRDGAYIAWYDSGAKKLDGRCENGEEHGTWRCYWPNGKPACEYSFAHGAAGPNAQFWNRRNRKVDIQTWLAEKLRGVPDTSPRFQQALNDARHGKSLQVCNEQ